MYQLYYRFTDTKRTFPPLFNEFFFRRCLIPLIAICRGTFDTSGPRLVLPAFESGYLQLIETGRRHANPMWWSSDSGPKPARKRARLRDCRPHVVVIIYARMLF